MLKVTDGDKNEQIYLICACFVSHNYCEAMKEQVSEGLIAETVQYDLQCLPPTQTNNYITDRNEGG